MDSAAPFRCAASARVSSWGLFVLAILLGVAGVAGASIVAVGYNGAVLTSDAGVSWTLEDQPTAKSFFGLAQGDQMIAVASDGAAFRSRDAVDWDPMMPVTPQWLMGAGTDGSTYVAVGTGGEILTSANGASWADPPSPTTTDLWAVAYDGSQWVAVGSDGVVVHSSDAGAWTLGPSSGATLRGIAHANGLWVGVGDGVIRTTSDLAAWTTRSTLVGGAFNAVAFDGAQWMAVGSGGNIRSSIDGINWVVRASGGASLHGVAPPCGGGWTAVGTTGAILTSATGVAWSAVGVGVTSENLRAVSCILTCSPLTSSVQTGSGVSFTAAGGSGAYTWTAQDGTTSSGNGNSFTTSFMAAGLYDVLLRDTNGAQNRTCTVRVTDPPPTTCRPGQSNLAPGNQVTFVAGDGVAPHTWTAPGTSSPGPVVQPTLTLTFPDEGEFTIRVRDSGPPVTEAECLVTVRRLSCSPPIREILVGQEATLQASGGVAPYLWSLPSARPAQATEGSVTATYGEVGSYVVALTDSDDPPKTVECVVQVVWPPASRDADVDGVPDEADNCPAVSNRDQADADRDAEGDACDETPGVGAKLPEEDAVGVGETFDRDRDDVIDALDNCRVVPNPSQDDQDRDGSGDACDADLDGDGHAQLVAVGLFPDNCPTVANARQDDEDADGLGDACDAPEAGGSMAESGLGAEAGRPRGVPWLEVGLVAAPLMAAAAAGLALWLQGRRRARKTK